MGRCNNFWQLVGQKQQLGCYLQKASSRSRSIMTGISEPALSEVFCMKRKCQALLSHLSTGIVTELASQCDWNPLAAYFKFSRVFQKFFFCHIQNQHSLIPTVGSFWVDFFLHCLLDFFIVGLNSIKEWRGRGTQRDTLGCQLQCCVRFSTLYFLFFIIQPVFLLESDRQDNWGVPALLSRSNSSAVVVKDIDELENDFSKPPGLCTLLERRRS